MHLFLWGHQTIGPLLPGCPAVAAVPWRLQGGRRGQRKGEGKGGGRCHLAPYRPDIPRVFVLASDCLAGRRVGALMAPGTSQWHKRHGAPFNIPINIQNLQIKKGARNGSMLVIVDGAEK